MDDIYPQEIIREYLEYKRLTTTLECLQAEVKSKSLAPQVVARKTDSVKLPKLYHFCMGDDAKHTTQMSNEKRLEHSLASFKSLKQSAKKVFDIAVNAVRMLEDCKVDEETLNGFKAQLSRLQSDVGGKGFKSNEAEVLETGYLQSIRNKIISSVSSKDYQELVKDLVKVRVGSLMVPQPQRIQLIKGLEEHDIFGGSLNLVLSIKNHSVITAAMALISIVCSNEAGRKYVLGNNAGYICTLIIKHLHSQENGSVCQRFILAALVKLSLTETAANCMITSHLIEDLIKILLHDSHDFVKMYATALIVNLLSFSEGRSHVFQNRDAFINVLHHLLTFAKHLDKELDVIYYCLMSCKLILQVIPEEDVVEDVTIIAQHVREQEGGKSEGEKSKILKICTSIISKKHLKPKERKQKSFEEHEEIYFECFTDETF